jgi:hypothetical protein
MLKCSEKSSPSAVVYFLQPEIFWLLAYDTEQSLVNQLCRGVERMGKLILWETPNVSSERFFVLDSTGEMTWYRDLGVSEPLGKIPLGQGRLKMRYVPGPSQFFKMCWFLVELEEVDQNGEASGKVISALLGTHGSDERLRWMEIMQMTSKTLMLCREM